MRDGQAEAWFHWYPIVPGAIASANTELANTKTKGMIELDRAETLK